jgi:hypothetical protein
MNITIAPPSAAHLAAALAAVNVAAVPPDAEKEGLRRLAARDVKPDFGADDEAAFGRPVSITHDTEAIYVVDAEAHEIRVFSRAGDFVEALGRKGQGPGEFDTPMDLDVRDGRLYVADKFNDRVQILDRKGRYLGGFKVPFSPDQICALEGGRIAVSHLPLGMQGSEPMVHCFSETGTLLWEGMPSASSGERTYDAFRNLHVMIGGERDDIFVVRKSDDNAIRRFDCTGRALAPIRVPAEYAFKTITLPLPGPEKALKAFCWDADFDGGRVGLLAPDYTEDGDIGPGRLIYLVRLDGSFDGVIEFPAVVRKFDLDGDMIHAIDDDYNLRIFRTGSR